MNKIYFSAKQAVIILILFLVLPAGLLSQLEINNAPGVYLSDAEPAVQIDALIREKFPQDQVLILLFEGQDLFQHNVLINLNHLATDLSRQDFVEKVLTFTTVESVKPVEDGFEIVPLVDVANFVQLEPHVIRQTVLQDRFAPGWLVSEDATAVAMVIRPNDMGNSVERNSLVQTTLGLMEQHHLMSWYQGSVGQVAVDVYQLNLMMQENMRLIPLTLGIALLLLWWMFRRVMAVVVGLVAMHTVSTATLALFVISGQPYTLVSTMMPSLLGALTVALLVHFYNSVLLAEQSGYQGNGRFTQALKQIYKPALFTSITTAAGLASLSLSPIVPIRTFGLISALGVFILFFIVMFIVPPLFAKWDNKSWSKTRFGVGIFDPMLESCSLLATRYPFLVVAGFAFVVFTCIPKITAIHTETNFLEYFESDSELVQATEKFQEQISGVTSLELLLTSSQRDGLLNAHSQNWIRAMQIWLEAQPEVDRTLSMAEYVEEMHWAFHDGVEDYRVVPQRDRLIAQYLKLYDGEDLYDIVDRDFAQTRILISVHEQGSQKIRGLMSRIEDRLNEVPLDQVTVQIAGDGRLFADQESLLISGQVRSLFGALSLIFISLLILFRSLPAAILCMIPNISPIILIFAVMGICGIWLDMATAMIASVAVGVAVDDTIHLFHAYRQSRQSGINVHQSIHIALTKVGAALSVTTIILSLQFGLLVVSGFKPIEYFGLLTTIGMMTALAFDLLLLPALVVIVERLRRSSTVS
ncbi:MAG TPA: RND transporter [Gammaproteobacteria bacterium]|nr:RND transporter [Gammaproteobacteria bacterium]